jgi:hypothetical protein
VASLNKGGLWLPGGPGNCNRRWGLNPIWFQIQIDSNCV